MTRMASMWSMPGSSPSSFRRMTPRRLGPGIELPHRRTDVRSGDHGLPLLDGQLGDERMEGVGDHADDEVGPADGRSQGGAVRDVEDLRGASRMAADELGGPAGLDVGDGHGEIRLVEKVFRRAARRPGRRRERALFS